MESFWECFGNVYTHFYTCTHILLCLVGFHVFQGPCLSLEMALPVPQNGPTVPPVIIFFYQKYFHLESFLECFESVYTYFYTCTLILLSLVGLYVFQWPNCPSKWPCLSLKNGPNVNVVIFLYQKGVLL